MFALLLALAITPSQERMIEYCEASGVDEANAIECTQYQVSEEQLTETLGDDQ